MKKLFVFLLVAALLAVIPGYALADAGGGTAATALWDVVIESGVEIVSAFFIALLGAFGAWLATKLGQKAQLSSINKAQREVISLAQQTVEELQQVMVGEMKAASKDGKLTKDEIRQLGDLLLDKTSAKMSLAAVKLLEAAKVDVSALITGAAESWIATIKQDG